MPRNLARDFTTIDTSFNSILIITNTPKNISKSQVLLSLLHNWETEAQSIHGANK